MYFRSNYNASERPTPDEEKKSKSLSRKRLSVTIAHFYKQIEYGL